MIRSRCPAHGRHAMGRIRPRNTLSVPAVSGSILAVGVTSLEQAHDAVVVGIGVGPQIRPVLELAAHRSGLATVASS